MRDLINIVESAEASALTAAIRAKAAGYIANGDRANDYGINNGMCDTLADEVVEELGGETDDLFTVWGENLTAVGEDGFADCHTWDIALLGRISPNNHPTHGLTWDDVNGHIPNHCWIIFNGRHYDAEAPEGVDNLFDLPLCRRMMRGVLIEKTEREHESARIQDAIDELDAQVEDLKRNWEPHHDDPDEITAVMVDLKRRRDVLVARLAR